MSELMRTTLTIEQELLEKFDVWIAKHSYGNRSEAVRDLMRNALIEEEWASPVAEVLAVLSIVFDHGKHTLAQALTHIQHEAHHCILCSQHVHLDRHKCVEVIVMTGIPETGYATWVFPSGATGGRGDYSNTNEHTYSGAWKCQRTGQPSCLRHKSSATRRSLEDVRARKPWLVSD